jgi:hypothetical protein
MSEVTMKATDSGGRPVLGAISGLFFGLFLSLALLTFGIVALDSIVIVILPVLFLLLGIVWGAWAPLGRRRAEPTPP